MNLNTGNSTEVATNNNDIFSLILSTVSFIVSLIAVVLIYNSLEITQKTLILTETEQKIRDIENSLALFYLPLRDYINDYTNEKAAINKNPKQEEFQSEILQIELNKIRSYAVGHHHIVFNNLLPI